MNASITIPDNLQEIADQIQKSGKPHRESVRTLLSWFKQQRRGQFVVSTIRTALKELKLTTKPDFSTAHIDAEISFERIEPGVDPKTTPETSESTSEPVIRLHSLASANRSPKTVSPNTTIKEAMTILLLSEFSVLPVVEGTKRKVRSVVSWESIGSAFAHGETATEVRHCLQPVKMLPADTPLLDAVDTILRDGVILVMGKDEMLSGLVTTTDLAQQFAELTGPFLLIAEIENHLRRLIDSRFELEELEQLVNKTELDREIESVHDLTFGQYRRLLEPPDNWERLGLSLDRKVVLERLTEVNRIRNDVMHFSPDELSDDDIQALRSVVALLQSIA